MAKKAVEKRTAAKKPSAVKTSTKTSVRSTLLKSAKPAAKVAAKPVVSPKAKPADKKTVVKSKPDLVKVSIKAVTEKKAALVAIKLISKPEKKVIVEVKPIPTIVTSAKFKPVKSILISQPKPDMGKSPYIDLAQQFKIKLDFRPFTHVEGIKAIDFRKQKIYIEQYSCVIFTSRIAIEQYFRICEELRIKISEDNKYFCNNETIALYLQKFIQYRKRKVFFGDGRLPKLMEVILKHKDDGKFLLSCSDVRDRALAEALQKQNIDYSEAVIYKTVASDLSDLSDVKYDMLVFFNPSAIDSLYANFPKFSQDETRMAIFGNSTAETVKTHNLNINVFAPTPENPSLVDAIKKYITEANKKGK